MRHLKTSGERTATTSSRAWLSTQSETSFKASVRLRPAFRPTVLTSRTIFSAASARFALFGHDERV